MIFGLTQPMLADHRKKTGARSNSGPFSRIQQKYINTTVILLQKPSKN
jgi:hypothetical protein